MSRTSIDSSSLQTQVRSGATFAVPVKASESEHQQTPSDTWTRDLEFQSNFSGKDGWLGADGAYSIPLSAKRSLWLFSDTLYGESVPEGMSHNSLAIETEGKLEFSPAQKFTPPDGKGWYWVYDGQLQGSQDSQHCQVFLGRFDEVPGGPEGLNFKFLDTWIADLKIGQTAKECEVEEYRRLSDLTPVPQSGDSAINFGAAICQDEHFRYIYGTKDFGFHKELVVARVSSHLAPDLMHSDGQWEFYSQGSWQKPQGNCPPPDSLQNSSGQPSQVSNELSVFFKDGLFHLVTQVGNEVQFLTSKSPQGPFSPSRTPQKIDEPAPGVMTYNAKAHPQNIDQQGRMLVGYNRNAFPPSLIMQEPNLYRPQFFRVTVA